MAAVGFSLLLLGRITVRSGPRPLRLRGNPRPGSGVHGLPEPNMGGEDFSFYLEHAPGCYARLGGRIAGRDPIPAHNPAFDWDERAIAVGARYFEAVAREAIRALT